MRRSLRREVLRLEYLEARTPLAADYLEAIGWTDLSSLLGPAMPTGAGVGVAQIEHREQNVGGYLPDPLSPAFVDKTLEPQSGPSTYSQHATRVGEHFYGSTAGVAPGISAVQIWEMDDWLNRALNVGTSLPPATEVQRIQNHSWNGSGAISDLERLRRFDYLIARDSVFAAVTIGNQGAMNVPRLLASSYNGMTVGLSNGTSNYGLTTFDGVGRVKPEIVAPESHTSQAAPQVAGAAALLTESARRMDWSPATKAAAQDSEVLKAVLLSGATKGQFSSWSRTEGEPLDQHFGAGQLNIFNSHHVLLAGEQNPGLIEARGWDYGTTNSPGLTREYRFTVPTGSLVGEASIALTWNREITSGVEGGFEELQSDLANLDLTLTRDSDNGPVQIQASRSTAANVEYLSVHGLTAGTYRISVSSNQPDVVYALAWNGQTASTATTIQAEVVEAVFGQPVSLTASVSSAGGSASGSVAFFDGSELLGTALLTAMGAQRVATIEANGLSVGTHSLRAMYVGQGNFVSSESAPISIAIVQPPGAFVAGRMAFYNQSRHDDGSAAASAADDAAIAADKTALLPGQTASFANVTSYSRGINGVMVDIAELPGSVTAGDFEFKVGNSNTPSSWLTTGSPTVSIRAGAGIGGSSRITLIWPSGSIAKQWLQVTVKANGNTGLAVPDVFYFGNAIGESGNGLDARVTISDEIAARNNPYSTAANGGVPAPVINRWDYNRDGNVSAQDQILARNNQTTVAAQLRLISVPAISGSVGLTAQSLADDSEPIARGLTILEPSPTWERDPLQSFNSSMDKSALPRPMSAPRLSESTIEPSEHRRRLARRTILENTDVPCPFPSRAAAGAPTDVDVLRGYRRLPSAD